MSGGEFPELLLLGILLLIGWTAHAVGTHVHVPRVTLLLLFGLFLGPSFLDVVPEEISEWFPHLAHLALAMVGFLLGESFVGRELRESGRVVMYASIGETIGAALLVFLVCILAGLSVPVSLLLAGIAPASAPAATLDVIREAHAKGPLSRTVIGVVAINDAWSVILFSVLMVIALGMSGAMDSNGVLLAGLWDVGGAVLLGVLLGIPMAWSLVIELHLKPEKGSGNDRPSSRGGLKMNATTLLTNTEEDSIKPWRFESSSHHSARKYGKS